MALLLLRLALIEGDVTMASLTAEIDVTEAHGAMQELVRLAMGAAFTTTSQTGLSLAKLALRIEGSCSRPNMA